MSLVLSKGMSIQQLGVNNAFPNGDFREEVYMKRPQG